MGRCNPIKVATFKPTMGAAKSCSGNLSLSLNYFLGVPAELNSFLS
jgi:hypothetical protein